MFFLFSQEKKKSIMIKGKWNQGRFGVYLFSFVLITLFYFILLFIFFYFGLQCSIWNPLEKKKVTRQKMRGKTFNKTKVIKNLDIFNTIQNKNPNNENIELPKS